MPFLPQSRDREVAGKTLEHLESYGSKINGRLLYAMQVIREEDMIFQMNFKIFFHTSNVSFCTAGLLP